jgi:hypothetical protein
VATAAVVADERAGRRIGRAAVNDDTEILDVLLAEYQSTARALVPHAILAVLKGADGDPIRLADALLPFQVFLDIAPLCAARLARARLGIIRTAIAVIGAERTPAIDAVRRRCAVAAAA